MSLWFSRQAKAGGRKLWLVDVPILPMLAVIGVCGWELLSLVHRYPWPAAISSLESMAMGLGCLVLAKSSLFRRGIWVSWGTRGMGKVHARCYYAGYLLIAAGGVLAMLVRLLSA